MFLPDMIAPLLRKRQTKAQRVVSPLDQLLIALQFYASGTFQSIVGNVLRISQSSVSRSIYDVSAVLSSLAGEHICIPTNLLRVIFVHVCIIQCINDSYK